MGFRNGLVIGKFSPPHAGHRWLINYALDNCEHLDVIIVHYDDRPHYIASAEVRRQWLYAMFPQWEPKRFTVWKFVPPPEFPDIDDELWARENSILIGRRPDALFSFEYERDKGYAQALGAAFVVPPGTPPVRATLIREHPDQYLNYVDPVIRDSVKEHLNG